MNIKRIYIIVALLLCHISLYSQQNLQNLLNEFKASIELPEYYNGKQLCTRSPYSVSNMYVSNGILSFQYSCGNQTYTSYYSVEIDLRQAKVEKGDNYNHNVWFSAPGYIIIRQTGGSNQETIMMDWFTFAAKSAGMRDRIYNELISIINPYKPQQTNVQPTSTPKKGSKKSSTPSNSTQRTSKSKSGKYGQ